MYEEKQLNHDRVQLLSEEGILRNDSELNLTDHQLVELYEWMVKTRLFDEKMLIMQRQGRIGTYAPFKGQEAAQVGSSFALDKNDWIFPSYREVAACMVHGYPMKQAILYYKGHLLGGHTPKGLNIFPIQIIIAGQTLHAAGCALASKLKGKKQVSVAYFGDGATSEGDFHEALNIAAVNSVPAVFFCQNNQWAISVPRDKQTVSETIAQKALAYGMTGVQVDGNDVLAVYQVMKDALERARNGHGPTLIEAVTYRQGPHTTADDPTKYRNPDESNEWVNKKDPLVRFRSLLEQRGLWDDEKELEARERMSTQIVEAVKEAEDTDILPLDRAFDHVYDEPHELLRNQQDEVRQFIAMKGEK